MRLFFVVAVFIAICKQESVSCVDDDNSWEPRQLVQLNNNNNNNNSSTALPVVHVLRVSSVGANDFGVYAATDWFNNASNWRGAAKQQRFQIRLHREAPNRVELTSVGHSLRSVLKVLANRTRPAYVAMIGPDYSIEAIPICQVTPFYNLVTVGTNTYNGFANIDNFPLYFRGTPTNIIYVKALLKLTELLGIGRVSTAGSTESYSLDRIGGFADLFKRQQHGVVDQTVVIERFADIQFSMYRLLLADSDIDYIITSLGENLPYVVCEAGRAIESFTKDSVHANTVAFLGMEHFEIQLNVSRLLPRAINCTQRQLLGYVNGSIVIQHNDLGYGDPQRYVRRKNFTQTETGAYYEAMRLLRERSRKFFNGTLALTSLVYNVFDMSWALYTALYELDERLEREEKSRLYDFLPAASNVSAAAYNRRHQFSTLLSEQLLNTTFVGITGKVKFNAEHDRIGNLDIFQFQGARKTLIASYNGETDTLDINDESALIFGTPSGEAPHVWRRKYSQKQTQVHNPSKNATALDIVIPIAVVLILLALSATVMFYRMRHLQRIRRERDEASSASNWIILVSLLTRQEPFARSKAINDSLTAVFATPRTNSSHSSTQSQAQRNAASRVFVGSVQVHVRNLTTTTRTSVSANAQLFIRLKQVAHDNVNRFIGVCFDYSAKEEEKRVVAVFEHQERGSIRRVLHNIEFGMDKDITVSFVGDCLRGLLALHERDVGHGLLHTGCVMLDAKLTCKLTDFGLGTFENRQGAVDVVELEQHQDDDDMDSGVLKQIFRPPEQLRDGIDGHDVKQIDIFSVAVVMAETINREEPTFTTASRKKLDFSSNLQIVKQQLLVANGVVEPLQLYIAEIDQSFPPPELRTLIVQRCANGEQPPRRPTALEVYKRFQTLTAQYTAGGSVVERLGKRLEQYTNDLQRVVDERTRALLDETRRTEQLLIQLLPASVCADLKSGRSVEPETFSCVSIHYSDIVGFTALSARASPMQIVVLLNTLYTTFDSVVDRHRTYKVETIGDAYIVVSGLPERTETHGIEICNFSLDIVATLQAFRIPYETNGDKSRLLMRIGVHCGPVAAGVVGIKMPRYCLFGNTVNEANRMESTGEPLRVHCSVEFYKLMQQTLLKKQHEFLTRRYEWKARTDDQHEKVCSYWLRKPTTK